ncbi:MAG TPA: hypothetical protein VJA21_21270 [Verrucomicrobiae bacterium]
MNRRIKLVIVGAAILAVVVLPLGTHYRAKWRADAYRGQVKTGGEPATLAELRPALSPEEILTGTDLMAAAGQFRLAFSNAPLMKFLGPGRALAACREEVLPTDESTNVWPGLESLLSLNEDGLGRARAALLGSAGFGFNLDYGLWPNLPLAHLANVKASAQWLSLSAGVELQVGRITNAWEDLEAIATLVTGYRKEPLMISELVRIAIAAIAINVSWEALQCPGWNDRQLKVLQDRWQELDLLSQAEAVLACERLFIEKTFDAGRGSFSAVNFQPGGSASGLAELAQVGKEIVDNPAAGVKSAVHRYPGYWAWKYWQSYDDEIAYGEILQAAIAAVRRAKTAGSPAIAVSDFNASAAAVSAAHPSAFKWLNDSRSGLGFSAAETTERFLTRIRTVEIQRALLGAAIALKRYELKHGRYPAELGGLCPEFAAQIPRDPMDGKPLRYRPNPDGTFLLYSIGENGVDDGGNPKPLAEAPRQWWRARDAVWPLPATPEQVEAEFRRARAELQKKASESKSTAGSALEAFRRRYGLLPPTPGTNSPAGHRQP